MKKTVYFALLLLISAFTLYAQSFDLKKDPQSAMALNGPWKFHTGDNPLWAQPSFDDSGWQDYTIDPKHSALTAVQALQSAQLPGWQQHGHPGYTGYAWYRIRLQTPQDAHSLALLMPPHVNDAYEVYVNGTKIGSLGKLDGFRTSYYGRAQVFSIPDALLHSSHSLTLAIRFWSLRYEGVPTLHNMAGGLRAAPLLGPSELLNVFQQSLHEQTWKMSWMGWLLAALDGAVGIVSLFLFLFGRRQREYLWAGISLLGEAIRIISVSIGPQMNLPIQLRGVVAIVAGWVGLFALPMAAMYLLDVARPLWRRANYVIMAVIVSNQVVFLGLELGLLPPTAALDRFSWVTLPFDAFFLLVLAIAVDGVRTIRRKAWLPLAPGVLFVCALATSISIKHPSIVGFSVANILFATVPIAVLVVFLVRFTEQQRENVRLVDDMRQAQEVQRVLIPAELPHVPGLTIESEYRPAREVGGDFFQIIPHANDGSVLIVAGDVTGHGLQAGMLVALIVGAIRNQADTNSDPLSMLQSLNRRLCGRGHAHATCLAMRIASDGAVTLANAGHLPPYLNGKELAMEGALPLGMIESADFSVMHFHLASGDTLMLMSDGVAEAQDEKGHLFGFERIHAMLQRPITAAEVATAAQTFGQQDDISVLSVQVLATTPA